MQRVELLVVGLVEFGTLLDQLDQINQAGKHWERTSLTQLSRSCCLPGFIQSETAVIPAGLLKIRKSMIGSAPPTAWEEGTRLHSTRTSVRGR